MLRYVDSDIETTEPPEIPGAASYSGYSGLAMAYDHWASQWEGFGVELQELIDAGGDVVAVTRQGGDGVDERGLEVGDAGGPAPRSTSRW